MEDKRVLKIEDIEAVVGGSMQDKWTEDEKKHLKELMNRHDYIANEYKAGRMSREDMDKAEDDVSWYCHTMMEKYK